MPDNARQKIRASLRPMCSQGDKCCKLLNVMYLKVKFQIHTLALLFMAGPAESSFAMYVTYRQLPPPLP